MNCQSCGKQVDAGSRMCVSCANQKIYGSSSNAKFQSWLTPKLIVIFCAMTFLICLVSLYFLLGEQTNAPKPQEIERDLLSFLSRSENCSVPVSVENFELLYIGDYIAGEGNFAINAWPIYAKANLVCNDSGVKVTFNLDGDAPCAYVRSSSFGYEIFIPDLLKQAQEQFQQEMDRAFDKMLSDL